MDDHAKFIDRFEGIAVPRSRMRNRAVDHGISGGMVNGVLMHGMAADGARLCTGRGRLFRTF